MNRMLGYRVDMESTHRSHSLGVIFILIAWLFFTFMTFGARIANEKVSLAAILFVQNLIGLITVLPQIKKQSWMVVKTNRFGLLVFRAIVSLAAIFLTYLAVRETTLAVTMSLSNSAPLWIPFAILIWLKTPLNHKLWPGIIAGFIGIVLILDPSKGFFQIGALYALMAGILQSLNMISLRLLSFTEKTQTVMFYYFVICSLITLPVTIYQWVSPGYIVWCEMIAIGLCFAIVQWTFVRAFHHAEASHLGPFCYSTIVYSIPIDWVVYNQIPGQLAWLGILLVCAGGIWAVRYNRLAQ